MIQSSRSSSGASVAADKLVVGEIPGEPPGFVERAELTRLEQLVGDHGRVVVCAGGRGVGKSALAAAYARAAIGDPAGPLVVVWVSGETQDAVVSGLVLLAQRANLDVDGEDARQTATRARDYLAGLPGGALLVVDNAENPERVSRWLPASPACRVILTSTDQAFDEISEPVQIGTYERAQSLTYLAARTGLTDVLGAERVCEALGDLPLALAQAGGVIRSRYLSFNDYLSELGRTTLVGALPKNSGYPRGLAEAFEVSVRAVTETTPQAGPVLDTMSVLDPNGVSRALLDELLTHDAARSGPGNLSQVTAVLAGRSLVTVTADRSSLVMHRLLARFLSETRTPAAHAHLVTQTATTLRAGLLDDSAPPPTPAFVADIATQTLALLAHTDDPRLNGDPVDQVCRAATDVGIWLYRVGAYLDMVAIDERTLAVSERVLGAEHPDTLTSRSNLAVGYRAVGRFEDAIGLHEETLAVRERVLGAEHPDTLTSRSNLALGYQAVGRFEDAIGLHEETLAVRERVLGAEHPDTLTSRNNLALGYQAVGRFEDAIGLHEETLAVSERVLGAEHPDTLTSRNNLALGYQAVGRFEDAIGLHEETLAVRERVLGAEHPDTLTSRNNLANGYQAVGRFEDAISLHEETLAVSERVLGAEHPDTLTSRNNLRRLKQEGSDRNPHP